MKQVEKIKNELKRKGVEKGMKGKGMKEKGWEFIGNIIQNKTVTWSRWKKTDEITYPRFVRERHFGSILLRCHLGICWPVGEPVLFFSHVFCIWQARRPKNNPVRR